MYFIGMMEIDNYILRES